MTEPEDINLNIEELQRFYQVYFNYYGTLNTQYQPVFVRRCLQFIEEKDIFGHDGFEPDNRIKALIAASAVQLTLGLEIWNLAYFDTIMLYASDFNSSQTGVKFKGETNLTGYIKLSWKSFLHGYSIRNDNVNLGLHEFSHALRFNGIKGEDHDYFVDYYFDAWLASAYEAFTHLEKGRKSIFRQYGGTNINEFMSVCIEHFFESPQEVREAYPLLFYTTAILLNQLPGPLQTDINARVALLEQKSSIMKGFEPKSFNTSHYDSASLRVLFIMLVPILFTVAQIGLFNGLSTVLLFLFFSVYFRFDFQYSRLFLDQRQLILEKGLFVFKRRKRLSLPLSALISVRKTNTDRKVPSWDLVYYNPADKYFYEESLFMPNIDVELFVKELAENRVACFDMHA